VSFETCTERLSFESCAIPFKLETSLQEIEREKKKYTIFFNLKHAPFLSSMQSFLEKSTLYFKDAFVL
jgi:hypothetical protein